MGKLIVTEFLTLDFGLQAHDLKGSSSQPKALATACATLMALA